MAAKKKPAPKKEKPIEGEVVDEEQGTGAPQSANRPAGTPERAIVMRVASPQEVAQWRPEFAKADVDRAVVQVKEKKRFFDEVMVPGSHYAIIPGQRPTPRINQKTGEQMMAADGKTPLMDPPKPALLKPGAEMLNAAMGLHPILPDRLRDPEYRTLEELRADEWYLEAQSYCEIRRQTGPGPDDYMVVASAGGSCNSWEDKYRYRGQKGRKCPQCGMEGTVRKGSQKFAPREGGKRDGPVLKGYEQGGFYCWRKMDGCGETFPDTDQRILSQSIEKEKNPNPHDLKNTLEKMADKRALVAATLLATGCSDLFTQDIEETASTQAAATAARTGDAADYSDVEDPGPPADAAPAPQAPQATKTPEATKATGGEKVGDYDKLEGWPALRLFHRYGVEHGDDPRVKLFRQFMVDHGLKTWGDLAAVWETKCPIEKDKAQGKLIREEIATLIMPLGNAPDQPLGKTA